MAAGNLSPSELALGRSRRALVGAAAVGILLVLIVSSGGNGPFHAAQVSRAGASSGASPNEEIGGNPCNCYGYVTTAVSGVPQYYDPGSAGCDAFMGVDPNDSGACQVYVMANVVEPYAQCNGSSWMTYFVKAGVPAGQDDNEFLVVDTCGAPYDVSFNDYDCDAPESDWEFGCPGASPSGYLGEPAAVLGAADYGPTSPYYSPEYLPSPFVVTSNFVQVPLGECQGATEGYASIVDGIVLEFNNCASYYSQQPDQPSDDNDTDNDTDNGTQDDWNDTGFDPCDPDNDTCQDTDAGSLTVSTGPAFGGGTACTFCAASWTATIPVTYAEENHTVLYLQPGTYHWTSSLADQAASPESGTLSVAAGVPGAVKSSLTYEGRFTFDETGLPPGKSWSVGLGGVSETTNGTSLSFTDSNGTYPYLIYGVPGYEGLLESSTTLAPPFGNLTASANEEIQLNFDKVRTSGSIVLDQKGDPKGFPWCVSFGTSAGLAADSCSPNGGAITLAGLPEKVSYLYSATAGFGLAPVEGQPFILDGTHDHVSVAFQDPSWTVNVHESGLPLGTAWSFKASGLPCGQPDSCGSTSSALPPAEKVAASGKTSSLSVVVHNGTFNWTVKKIGGYELALGNGTDWTHQWTVWGMNLAINVTFVPYTYNVTFSEVGLPVGTNWSVEIAGGVHASTTSTITVELANGTYKYTLGTVSGYTGKGEPSAVVVHGSGRATHVGITFSPSTSGAPASLFAGFLRRVARG
jgi:hypothetical protein